MSTLPSKPKLAECLSRRGRLRLIAGKLEVEQIGFERSVRARTDGGQNN